MIDILIYGLLLYYGVGFLLGVVGAVGWLVKELCNGARLEAGTGPDVAVSILLCTFVWPYVGWMFYTEWRDQRRRAKRYRT